FELGVVGFELGVVGFELGVVGFELGMVGHGDTSGTPWGTGDTSRSPRLVGFELGVVGFELGMVGFELGMVGFELGMVGFELGMVSVPALSCLFFHVMWELSRLPDSGVPQVGFFGNFRGIRCFYDSPVGSMSQSRSHSLWNSHSQAFVVLSDLLVVLGPALPRALEPLALPPEPGLHSQLASFLMDHVFLQPPENREEPHAAEEAEGRLEELHRRRQLLAGFCKVLLHGGLELRRASDVFKHYSKVWECRECREGLQGALGILGGPP
ncbi:PREDICTED: cohesin subunit SA-3-like, partial [Lepidothrix coronata]|uniref:Cohesin subunit SA-3-like n=1 Tax=Lepidothrix coronata TaxID=321398 RepID=A0A6J0J8W6_9PASS